MGLHLTRRPGGVGSPRPAAASVRVGRRPTSCDQRWFLKFPNDYSQILMSLSAWKKALAGSQGLQPTPGLLHSRTREAAGPSTCHQLPARPVSAESRPAVTGQGALRGSLGEGSSTC